MASERHPVHETPTAKLHTAPHAAPHTVAPREYTPTEHPPLLCLHPYWTRYRKVWAVIGTVVVLAAGFFGTWSVKGAVSEMDARWMSHALADSRWAGQRDVNKEQAAQIEALKLGLVRLDVQMQGVDYTGKVNGDKLDALLLSFGVPKPPPPPNPPPPPPPAPPVPMLVPTLVPVLGPGEVR